MLSLKNIPLSQAIPLWNEFTQSLEGLVPLSFTPSLYNFYLHHFNWKPYYIMVFNRGVLCGLLPLVNTGKAWVSLPHFSYGGLISKNNPSDLTFSVPLESLIGKLTNLDAGFYEIAIDKPIADATNNDFKIFVRSMNRKLGELKSEKTTSLLLLPSTENQLFRSINPNLRRKIRKSTKSEIQIMQGRGELLNDFYEVYTKNIRQLKSLNYSKSFFADLIKHWDEENCHLFIAYHHGKPVGASMLISYNSFYENIFFATLMEYRKWYVSDFLHWNMMTVALHQSKSYPLLKNPVYSFGRSSFNSGVYHYKNHWPVVNYPLYNYINYSDIRQKDGLYYLWGLLPKFMTHTLGKYLIKHIY